MTRDRERSSRKREVRAHTMQMRKMVVEVRRERHLLLLTGQAIDHERPKTRAECLPGGPNEARPCVFVSCAHNLYLDVSERTGSIKVNYPELDPEDMGHSCCLDLADAGGMTLEAVGEVLNVTRERLRQIEAKALPMLRPLMEKYADDFGLTSGKDSP